MISRTYGRRSGGLNMSQSHTAANSLSDGLSESSSQEFSQDVYGFTFPSQDSTCCQWSDPYNFSSQESSQLAFLPPRESGNNGGGFRKSKKVKTTGVDLERNGVSSSQESKDFEVLEISPGAFQKSKKLKKVDSGPYEHNSSQELEDLLVLPQMRGRENRVSDFSKYGDLKKSMKSKNVEPDSYLLNSSHDLGELGIIQPRKSERNVDCSEFDGVSGKSKKKDKGGNGISPKKKKKKLKSKVSEPEYVELTSTLMETQEFGEMMEHSDEVNFALDGLKKGQPVRVRRASLLSLLSISGTVQQRRLLRVHGYLVLILHFSQHNFCKILVAINSSTFSFPLSLPWFNILLCWLLVLG